MHLPADSETEQWVLRELSLHEKIRSREICVLARDGVVRLQGSAQSYSDRLAVEEATRGAAGSLLDLYAHSSWEFTWH